MSIHEAIQRNTIGIIAMERTLLFLVHEMGAAIREQRPPDARVLAIALAMMQEAKELMDEMSP